MGLCLPTCPGTPPLVQLVFGRGFRRAEPRGAPQAPPVPICATVSRSPKPPQGVSTGGRRWIRAASVCCPWPPLAMGIACSTLPPWVRLGLIPRETANQSLGRTPGSPFGSRTHPVWWEARMLLLLGVQEQWQSPGSVGVGRLEGKGLPAACVLLKSFSQSVWPVSLDS